MILGNILLGCGIALLKLDYLGNDPSSAFTMALGDRIGLSFATLNILVQGTYCAVEFIFDGKMIGLGTVINWFGIGYVVALTTTVITAFIPLPDTFLCHVILMVLGLLVIALGASLYQEADLGISPYDSLSLIMAKRLPLPYFWCRIITDGTEALLALLLGGIVSLGTAASALGLGPFIAFFTRTVAKPLLGTREG